MNLSNYYIYIYSLLDCFEKKISSAVTNHSFTEENIRLLCGNIVICEYNNMVH